MNSFRSTQLISQFKHQPPTKLTALASIPAIDPDDMPKLAVPITLDEGSEARRQKLSNVINELKIHDLDIISDLKHRLVGIIDRCLDAFASDDNDLGFCNIVEHAINTADAHPVREKLSLVHFHRRPFVDKEIERYLFRVIICKADPGKCPWASAIVVVNKKENDLAKLLDALRMCHDYRKVNALTIKDAYPLPLINDILVGLGKAKYFVSLDLLMGYHQIPVKESDRPKTAFITHRGLFMFKRMPFGLCNAPATFHRLMDALFEGKIGQEILVFLDDILIFAETPEQLLDALERTLQTLARAGLKCKHRKCQLFRTFVEYLGHIISDKGIAPDPKKIEKIRDWPAPETGNGLLSFLGFCNYYRRLIPHFAELSAPLYAVAQQKKIDMNAILLDAFVKLKDAMCATVSLRIPDPKSPFILETDASNVALALF